MPTVLVNFAHLDPPNNGGISRLAREVARALLAEASLRLVFVVRLRFLPQFKNWLGIGRNPAVIPYTHHIPTSLILRLVRPAVIVSPLFGTEPFTHFGAARHIISIPDTLALDHPDLFSRAEAQSRREIYQRALAADRIITLSQYARSQLLQYFPVSADRIQVIELGGDGLPSPTPLPLISPPYVFYPANTWLHKRHNLLLQVMALIWKTRPEIKLVLSGGRPPNVDLAGLIAQYAPAESVLDLGYITEPQVSTLYRHAEALLFTSQYEGFGMPVLEAMQAGCPVICAPVTAIPEVAGDAPLYVQSDSPEVWASAFLNQLPTQREILIQRSYQQAARFTWAQTRRNWVEAVLSAISSASG